MTEYIHGYPIIDLDNIVRPPGFDQNEFGTGYEPRDYAEWPMNGQEYNRGATIERLDESVIKELIAEKNAKKNWITDLCDRVGSKVKNQKNSSYCWIHAPTRGMECAIVESGGAPLTLSAFYAGSQIKGGRNQGGSGVTGVNWLAKHGTCLESMWPPMQFRGQNTPEIQNNASLHQITIYEELDPHDYQMIWSCIVQNQPVTVGIPAWSHEVLLTFLVLNGNNIAEGFDNSWGESFGSSGRAVLSGSKRRFDEAGRIAAIEQSAT